MTKKSNDKKLKLIDSDESDKEDLKELTINKNYADRYNNWREKEELQKCISIFLIF
jgi:hypothetical protein